MNYPSRKVIEELKAKYKLGTVVNLDKMPDEQTSMLNTPGIVTSVDDIGTVHFDWLTGSTLGVAYPVDEIHIADVHEAALYYMVKSQNANNPILMPLFLPSLWRGDGWNPPTRLIQKSRCDYL